MQKTLPWPCLRHFSKTLLQNGSKLPQQCAVRWENANPACSSQGLHEDTDSEDEWTDDEMEVTALDSVDPYISFANALSTVEVPQNLCQANAQLHAVVSSDCPDKASEIDSVLRPSAHAITNRDSPSCEEQASDTEDRAKWKHDRLENIQGGIRASCV